VAVPADWFAGAVSVKIDVWTAVICRGENEAVMPAEMPDTFSATACEKPSVLATETA